MEFHSGVVGPFCCVAAVCPPCTLYTDVADRAFRTRHHLLHALEQGEGRCAVRQYLRKAGSVSCQEQVRKPRASQQQTPAQQEQRWRQPQRDTRTSSSRPELPGRWTGAGIETMPQKAETIGGREAHVCTSHGVDTKEANGEAHTGRNIAPCPCVSTVSGTRMPTRTPIVSATATHASYKTVLPSECTNATSGEARPYASGTSSLSCTPECERSIPASVTRISERCTRWKVLQLACASIEETEGGMTEQNGKAGYVKVSGSERQEAVPRPPDVLLACTDYLLRSLLPSVIFPSQNRYGGDNFSAGPRAATNQRGTCAGVRRAFPALVNKADSAVVGGVKISGGAVAAPDAAAGDKHPATATLLPRSASERDGKQPQETSAAEGVKSCPDVAPASSDFVCRCLCHRLALDGPSQDHTSECAEPVSGAAVSPSYVAGSTGGADLAATCNLRGNVAATTATVSTVDNSSFDDAAAGIGVYSFFADRLRALRQEAVVQQLLHRPLYFLLLLQSVRFHLFADVFWGGGLFNRKADKCTNVTGAAADGKAATAMLLEYMEQEQLLQRPTSSPHQSSNIANYRDTGRAGKAHPVRNAGSSNTTTTCSMKKCGNAATSTVNSALAPAAAATLLQTVGYSASLNRFLLASCMQQLLNFIISRARRFFCQQQRVRQQGRVRRQQHSEGSSAGCPASAVDAQRDTNISTATHKDVCGQTISRRAYSAEFHKFASLLQVQPQDVDEVVACALLYLLLPCEDTPAHHQAVQLLLQETAAAFHSFWCECHWTRYARRLILLDFLRAATAADIKAAAPLSSPGTRLPLVRLQQLLHCEMPAAAMRLAYATGASVQQQQPATHNSQEHRRWSGELKRQYLPEQQRHEQEEIASTVPSAASVNVYFCRGSRSSSEVGQCQPTRVKEHQPHGRSESAAIFGSQSCKARVELPGYSFPWLQSDAWQPSPPHRRFLFPRSKTEMRNLFDWPVHCTTLKPSL